MEHGRENAWDVRNLERHALGSAGGMGWELTQPSFHKVGERGWSLVLLMIAEI